MVIALETTYSHDLYIIMSRFNNWSDPVEPFSINSTTGYVSPPVDSQLYNEVCDPPVSSVSFSTLTMTRIKRIPQRVCCPDEDVGTSLWNDGTGEEFAERIFFNGKDGIHVHRILGNQSLSGVVDRAGEHVRNMPTQKTIELYVSVCTRGLLIPC